MKSCLYICILILSAACSPKKSGAGILTPDTSNEQELQTKRRSFHKLSEITADSASSIWVKNQGETFSLALHFQYKDTLAISYSPECWLLYPYRIDGDKIIVYWDKSIDTKYDFDIVKAIHNIDDAYLGKPFMTLELANDTTLKATYTLEKLIEKINRTSNKRTFFPDAFNLVQDGEMYD